MRWNLIGGLLGAGLLCVSGSVRAQDACDPATFDRTCNGAVLTLCGTANTTETVDCANDLFTTPQNVTCGFEGCVGAPCADFEETCVGPPGGTCVGYSPIIFDNAADAFFPLCQDGNSCVTSIDPQQLVVSDTCVPQVGADCAVGEQHKGCVDNVATVCVGGTGFAVADALGVDCSSYGATCVTDGTGAPFCESASGEVCDPIGANPLLRCATGLACNPLTLLCETACDPSVADTCNGNTLTFCDSGSNASFDIDCANAAIAGTCASGQGNADSICQGGEGGTCDDPAQFPNSPFKCAAGLVCANIQPDGTGTCTATGVPVDGGQAPVDGGQAPVDGGPAPVDGGPAPVDGGQAPVDGGQAPVDSGPAPVDAGNDVDGGNAPPPEDAGNNPPPADAGNNPPPEDAGNNPPPADAGNNNGGNDAGNGGNGGDDAGNKDDEPQDPPGGCACGSSTTDGMGFGLFALALLALRRRRR